MNLYGYAAGDPINNSDPFGLCPFCPLAYAGAEGGAVIGTAILPGPGTVIGGLIGAALGGIGGYLLADAISDAVNGDSGPERTIDDPGSLTGAIPEEVEGAVPDGWVKTPTREGEGSGTRYSNPERRGEQVRVMPGKANDPTKLKQGPYVVVSKDGNVVRVPLAGNPTLPNP